MDPSVIRRDIRLFLEHGPRKLAERHGIEQDGWPTDDHLDLLCERAAGLFVYAAATLKFLDHSFTPPNEQLDLILRTPNHTTHEGQAKLQPGTTLNLLYLSALQSAFSRTGVQDDEIIHSVISAVILVVNPLPPSAIAILVKLGKQRVINLLQLIQSFLKFPEDTDLPVLPFHKSFPDFITNSLCCPDQRLHISPQTGHSKLALHCLKLMNDSLGKNPLSLPDYVLNSEVKDLKARIDNYADTALRYACRSWYTHLTEVRGDVTTIVPALQSFLQKSFMAWLEVLSVIGTARDAITALEKMIPWLQKVCFSPFHCISILMHTLN